jgi:hypothetical protein
MQEWLTAQMANGFSALQGTALTGSVPVKEELINELIAAFLANTGEPSKAELPVDPRLFTSFIRKATVQAQPGIVTLHFEIRI